CGTSVAEACTTSEESFVALASRKRLMLSGSNHRASHQNNDPTGAHWMLDEFVSAGNVHQRNSLGDLEARPTGFERSIQIPRGLCLCLFRKVVAAQEEHADVFEHHRPEGDVWRSVIGGIRCDGTADPQQVDIGLDVCGKRDVDNVVTALRNECSDP